MVATIIPFTPEPEQPALVGRQPILDRQARLVAYELLFRHPSLTPGASDDDAATADVIVNTFLEIGFDEVVGEHDAFINASRGFLLSGFAHQLPPGRVVIEVLETVAPDRDVLEALRALRSAGYRVALDDFVYRPELQPFVDLADLVKIDLERFAPDEDWATALSPLPKRLKLLAERVETRQQFDRTVELGFELFQGFYFARAAVLRGQRPQSNRLTLLRVLTLVSNPQADVEELESAISADVALSYKLLRVINSAQFGLVTRIESLAQAIVYLGRERIRSWVALMALGGLGSGASTVATTALIRAHMCQELAAASRAARPDHGFMVGLLSALDALLGTPMEDVVRLLPVSDDVKAALTTRQGASGALLEAVLAYERWDLEAVALSGHSVQALRGAYLDAMRWAHRQGLERAAEASVEAGPVNQSASR